MDFRAEVLYDGGSHTSREVTLREACEEWHSFAASNLSPNVDAASITSLKALELDLLYRELLRRGGEGGKPVSLSR